MNRLAGIWNLNGQPADETSLAALASRIAHRGRDGFAVWCHGAIGFVACVGVVSPESGIENQPLNDEHGNALLFDGRLDNREELLSQLGAAAETVLLPDSALVFEAFGRWGDECVSRLNGEFALAIFDRRKQQLILARDPVGCRPLYYWSDNATVAFASEIKAVLAHPHVAARPNEDLIADYLVRDRLAYEDEGETFFRGIYAVLPGERLTVSSRGVRRTKFWDFDPESIIRLPSYSHYALELRHLLFQSVNRRLRRAAPVAIAVSGGLDSSIVVCIAERLRRDGATQTPLLPVCLAGHERLPNDPDPLTLLESQTDLRIERLNYGAPGTQAQLEAAAWASELPRFDDGWCAQTPMFTWAAAHGATTLLTGRWSDQLSFATAYLSDLFTSFKWTDIAAHLDEYTRWFVDANPQYFRTRFMRELVVSLTPYRLRRILRPLIRSRCSPHRRRLVNPAMVERIERTRPKFGRPRSRSAHARAIYNVVRTQAHRIQFEADAKLAASYNVEWTTPFLDRDLIAFLMAVPGDIQNRDGVPRALLRDSMRGVVPDGLINRKWSNDDEFMRTRQVHYLSTVSTLDASYQLEFLREPFRVERNTLDFIGLESWSRAFFSDRLTSPQHPRSGVPEPMDTRDPAPTDDREKLPYSPPRLTIHGDLRTITAAKESDRSEAGQPKTFSGGMP